VPNGAIVEREVHADLGSLHELTLQLRNPDFSTAVAVTDAINAHAAARWGKAVATEEDSRTVRIRRPEKVSAARFLAEIENVRVETDAPARVVVDERTGTVVIGAEVKLSTVAISHGALTVRVTEQPRVVQPEPFSDGETAEEPMTVIEADQPDGTVAVVEGPRPRHAGGGAEPAGRQARRHHRHPPGRQVGRRASGRARPAMRFFMPFRRALRIPATLALLLCAAAAQATGTGEPAGVAPAPDAAQSEVERFCGNIADAARDRRHALQKAENRAAAGRARPKAEALEEKRAEYERWLKKRDDFMALAQEKRRQHLPHHAAGRRGRAPGRAPRGARRRHPDEARRAQGRRDPERDGVEVGRRRDFSHGGRGGTARSLMKPLLVALSALLISSGCASRQQLAEIGREPALSPVGSGIDPGVSAVSLEDYPKAPASPVKRFSLWDDRQSRLFTDPRALRTGDILTVKIRISDRAKLQNESERSRTASRSLEAEAGFDWDFIDLPSGSLEGSIGSGTSTGWRRLHRALGEHRSARRRRGDGRAAQRQSGDPRQPGGAGERRAARAHHRGHRAAQGHRRGEHDLL
jgi:hypothetical protein